MFFKKVNFSVLKERNVYKQSNLSMKFYFQFLFFIEKGILRCCAVTVRFTATCQQQNQTLYAFLFCYHIKLKIIIFNSFNIELYYLLTSSALLFLI